MCISYVLAPCIVFGLLRWWTLLFKGNISMFYSSIVLLLWLSIICRMRQLRSMSKEQVELVLGLFFPQLPLHTTNCDLCMLPRMVPCSVHLSGNVAACGFKQETWTEVYFLNHHFNHIYNIINLNVKNDLISKQTPYIKTWNWAGKCDLVAVQVQATRYSSPMLSNIKINGKQSTQMLL